mmetsp:Transcript_106448/g.308038  ORF Transcript_106448/g.308038 Transcript_106448/m.308038 type:complete len:354 (-) Transcript_106448:1357-2418(-)
MPLAGRPRLRRQAIGRPTFGAQARTSRRRTTTPSSSGSRGPRGEAGRRSGSDGRPKRQGIVVERRAAAVSKRSSLRCPPVERGAAWLRRSPAGVWQGRRAPAPPCNSTAASGAVPRGHGRRGRSRRPRTTPAFGPRSCGAARRRSQRTTTPWSGKNPGASLCNAGRNVGRRGRLRRRPATRPWMLRARAAEAPRGPAARATLAARSRLWAPCRRRCAGVWRSGSRSAGRSGCSGRARGASCASVPAGAGRALRRRPRTGRSPQCGYRRWSTRAVGAPRSRRRHPRAAAEAAVAGSDGRPGRGPPERCGQARRMRRTGRKAADRCSIRTRSARTTGRSSLERCSTSARSVVAQL